MCLLSLWLSIVRWIDTLLKCNHEPLKWCYKIIPIITLFFSQVLYLLKSLGSRVCHFLPHGVLAEMLQICYWQEPTIIIARSGCVTYCGITIKSFPEPYSPWGRGDLHFHSPQWNTIVHCKLCIGFSATCKLILVLILPTVDRGFKSCPGTIAQWP